MRMQRIGSWLLVEDNGGCGGAGVSFTGLFRRQKIGRRPRRRLRPLVDVLPPWKWSKTCSALAARQRSGISAMRTIGNYITASKPLLLMGERSFSVAPRGRLAPRARALAHVARTDATTIRQPQTRSGGAFAQIEPRQPPLRWAARPGGNLAPEGKEFARTRPSIKFLCADRSEHVSFDGTLDAEGRWRAGWGEPNANEKKPTRTNAH